MNKPRFTRKTLIDSACAHYGLENPITIAMCEINEAHPNDDRYTFIMETLYIYGSVGMGEGYGEDYESPALADALYDDDDYSSFWDAKIKEI